MQITLEKWWEERERDYNYNMFIAVFSFSIRNADKIF